MIYLSIGAVRNCAVVELVVQPSYVRPAIAKNSTHTPVGEFAPVASEVAIRVLALATLQANYLQRTLAAYIRLRIVSPKHARTRSGFAIAVATFN